MWNELLRIIWGCCCCHQIVWHDVVLCQDLSIKTTAIGIFIKEAFNRELDRNESWSMWAKYEIIYTKSDRGFWHITTRCIEVPKTSRMHKWYHCDPININTRGGWTSMGNENDLLNKVQNELLEKNCIEGL